MNTLFYYYAIIAHHARSNKYPLYQMPYFQNVFFNVNILHQDFITRALDKIHSKLLYYISLHQNEQSLARYWVYAAQNLTFHL